MFQNKFFLTIKTASNNMKSVYFPLLPTFVWPMLNECRGKVKQKLGEVFKQFPLDLTFRTKEMLYGSLAKFDQIYYSNLIQIPFDKLSTFFILLTNSQTCSNRLNIHFTKLSNKKSSRSRNCLNGPWNNSMCFIFEEGLLSKGRLGLRFVGGGGQLLFYIYLEF